MKRTRACLSPWVKERSSAWFSVVDLPRSFSFSAVFSLWVHIIKLGQAEIVSERLKLDFLGGRTALAEILCELHVHLWIFRRQSFRC